MYVHVCVYPYKGVDIGRLMPVCIAEHACLIIHMQAIAYAHAYIYKDMLIRM